MRKWTMALVILMAITVLAGCGGKKYEAVPINEEVDICANCKMQVKDDAYATQLTTKDGKTLKFDDIGCMNKWKSSNGADNIGMDYVRDYNDKDWIEYKKASYVYDASLRTPMAYGIISFKDKKSAEAFIAEQGVGKLMSSEDLSSHTWEQNRDMMKMGDMDEHNEENMHSEMDGDKKNDMGM
ncbi:nitrous oxide reductase accessory protein NosL [Cohnella sp. WQ 127256]|uniref:nitrous oxide reductase accessory protein NosL n=1 Tax=Cohnella sp. WQ 127256 TaxID=2938790 RepID=UPI0021175559|nr:nitrous oxide reductase accessory protein NosL [Cohnella sp. WQ 127256]